MKVLLSLLACLLAAESVQAATGVSAPDTLDSRAPVIQFVYPAGLETFQSAAQESIRFTIAEPSWGPAPSNITMTIMPSGDVQTQVEITPEPDGTYLHVLTVPELVFNSEAETRIRILATDRFGWLGARYSSWFTITEETVSSVPSVAMRNRLDPVHPNPFNPRTTISFSLAAPSEVDLAVYDVRGRQITSLVHEHRAAGVHEAIWPGLMADGSPAASGVYFARLEIRGADSSRTFVTRLALVK